MFIALILFFVGRWFFRLASFHNRPALLFAFLGNIVLILLFTSGPVFVQALALVSGQDFFLKIPDIYQNAFGLPIAIFGTWDFHRTLGKAWTRNPK